ncbi:OsmC-like protein [Mycobacteroides abscessus subsp. massiliense]|nr:OsmC-like protein [Mycobacteroides abscessus subsp. massiliense]SKK90812.1 OsmC-like protein [Mycobacteroides abscessus subsp. massiliense]SKL19556.1 OsmC-like protein [Mycobacteroides abscessus subsp. massiliense]SKL79697.1 OsmC-like protein [Mycobacteroides abscessus subsp. massiliense]SKQ26313.1 OsmC-like protein [Mycobacteroides abscessus subsp. massiliense]
MQLALMHVTASATSLNAITDATREAVTDKPAAAHVVFKASAQPEGTVGSEISLGKYRVHVDEPPSLGGQNTAPNPVEYYLASLLSCQVVTYRFWAERLGIQVDSLSASAEGDLDVRGFFGLDDSVRPGFQQIRVTVTVAGPDTDARYRELQEAVDAHCPVLDLTTGTTPVHTTLITQGRP